MKISFFLCWKQHDAFYCSRHRPKAINASGKMVWSIYWSNIQYPFYYLILSKTFILYSLHFNFFKFQRTLRYFQWYSSGSWCHSIIFSQHAIHRSKYVFDNHTVTSFFFYRLVNNSLEQIYTKRVKNIW